ncbi:MAG: A/G-specific adenine glycosylase [Bacteroidota bacterium]
MKNKRFSEKLINWYTERKRDLPWRKSKNPYQVWLSEIILQQTRVEQGLPYYLRFVSSFPTVKDLASAPEANVLRLWQGLGYYSRARNLHATSKMVVDDYGGVFPTSYEEILKLKGVGPYTAAAIASICFDEPKPVVDGNVFRFASRYFLIEEDIAKNKTRKTFEKVLADQISVEQPGNFNQAMMDFGSTICSPSPKCDQCIFNLECISRQKGIHLTLPVKSKKLKIRDRNFHYLVLHSKDRFLLKERKEKDIWYGLYDFLLLEGDYADENVLQHISERVTEDFVFEEKSARTKHILSHQRIYAVFYRIEVSDGSLENIRRKTDASVYSKQEILNLPKPKLIVNYLSQIGIKS